MARGYCYDSSDIGCRSHYFKSIFMCLLYFFNRNRPVQYEKSKYQIFLVNVVNWPRSSANLVNYEDKLSFRLITLNSLNEVVVTQLEFACSKSAMKTPEQSVIFFFFF